MPRPARTIRLALLGIAVAAGATGCSGGTSLTGADGTDALGWIEPAKQISVPLPSGEPINGARPEANELVLVNFWASWCDPCKIEMPLLDQVDVEPGVTVIGVARDQYRKNAQKLITETGVDFPSWHDPDGDYLGRFAGVVQLSTVPNSALIKDGRVVAVHVGEITSRAEADKALDKFR